MEQLPQIGDCIRFSLTIDPRPHFFDHSIGGRAVLPAVEAMQILVASVADRFPEVQSDVIEEASFPKFLSLENNQGGLEAINEIEMLDQNRIRSSLQTRVRFKSGISRWLTHASLVLLLSEASTPNIHLPSVESAQKGIQIQVDTIYRELVHFGDAFQNLRDPFVIDEKGATATLFGGKPVQPPLTTGSPYPLDAAFHAACAWGKHFRGIVTFPIGFKKRYILVKTGFNTRYTAQINFKSSSDKTLIFDIAIRDTTTALCEIVQELQMRKKAGQA